ncbi:MAG: hypothetical protein WC538_08920 [Thermoanaerobaculia bacterium]|jgi:hypothetical protein
MTRVSGGFACALAGVAISLLAWNGPWSWPAWPALALLAVAFPPERSFALLPFAGRTAVIAIAVAVNVAAWGYATALLLRLLRGRAPSASRE